MAHMVSMDGYVGESFSAPISDRETLTRDVYRPARSGPVVIVIHEATGLTRKTLGIATSVQNAGMTPVLPVLAGQPLPGLLGGLKVFAAICVKREFGALARNEATPTVRWLRALARHEFGESGKRPVGVIGMCFSGGYALAMALTPEIGAVVSSQPAFPAALPGRRRHFGVNEEDLDTLRTLTNDGACVRTLRYQRDPLSPGVRHDEIRRQLPASIPVEIRTWNPCDHPVLADGLRADPNSQLGSALTDTVEFLRQHLGVERDAGAQGRDAGA